MFPRVLGYQRESDTKVGDIMDARVYQGDFTLDKKVLACFINPNDNKNKNTFKHPNSIGIQLMKPTLQIPNGIKK